MDEVIEPQTEHEEDEETPNIVIIKITNVGRPENEYLIGTYHQAVAKGYSFDGELMFFVKDPPHFTKGVGSRESHCIIICGDPKNLPWRE